MKMPTRGFKMHVLFVIMELLEKLRRMPCSLFDEQLLFVIVGLLESRREMPILLFEQLLPVMVQSMESSRYMPYWLCKKVLLDMVLDCTPVFGQVVKQHYIFSIYKANSSSNSFGGR